MSFIFGIIDFWKKPIRPLEIEALADAVGWDGFVKQTFLDKNMALGFCHHPGRKPKAGIYSDEEIIVIADIRIYNKESLNETFDYRSPEEALAKAFRLWGSDCANHINGDFAAMIFDRQKNEVHLFRDHIGTRPLTYWFSDHKLIFASHEFGLVKSGLVKPALSEEKLIDTFFHLKNTYAQTAFKDIFKVIPGHCVSFSADGSQKDKKYWKPELFKKNTTLTFKASAARLQDLIVMATKNRMEPVKTGLHISGGLDSCGVASIVADHTPDKSLLTGYSWTPETFEDTVEGINEKEYIDAFSADKNIKVEYLNLEENEIVKNSIIPEFETQHIEHPVMKLAEKNNIEMMFSGWGGDEFVSLGTRGTMNHLFFSFKWATLLQYCKVKGIKSSIYQLRTDVLPFLIPFGLLPVYKTQRSDWYILRLLKPAFICKHWKQIFRHQPKNNFGYGNRTRFVLNLLELRHLPERMDSWAINAERYGFEYKYPLLDKEVLEFWFSIPIEHTYKDFHSRLLYREAMKGILPEKIRTRKDKGEAIRIAYSLKERRNGKKYLENLFYSLSPQEHLPFFKPEAFKKLFEKPFSNNTLKDFRNMNKYTLYLRYIALVKKYISIRT